MPELPEVETVKRQLEKNLINVKLLTPEIYYPNLIKTDIEEYKRILTGATITSLSRKGKFLIVNLNNNYKVLFHLRMEGKLFIIDKDRHPTKHLSMMIPFSSSNQALGFYDTRKFGVSYCLRNDELGPLASLGLEPFEIDDINYLYQRYTSSNKPIKELLLDQSIMCGLGNIYADEVCFASSISPFLLGSKLSLDNVKAILENSKKILLKAIENNGSTVHSYKASQDVSGSFQNFLKVYSNEGKLCSRCKSVKIEKRRLGGRGTSLCVKCQHAGVNVAITGKIASGKSLVLSAFEKLGYKTFSADKEVALLYSDENFLKELKKKFPTVFTPELDKKVIAEKLISDKKFKREYETYIHSIIKTKVNEFIVKHDGLDKAFEIPLLFDAKMDKSFTFTIGVESNKQLEHLKIRGDKDAEKRLDFNNINSFDKNKHKLDYIIVNDFDKEELFDKVKEIDKDIKKKMREN